MDGHLSDFRHWTESRLQADSPPQLTRFLEVKVVTTGTLNGCERPSP